MDLRLTTVDELLDDNPVEGDLYLDEHGDVLWVVDKAAIAQHIRIRLRFVLAEWFLNTAEGIDYFGVIFEKGASDEQITGIYRRAILGTPGVAGLAELRIVRMAAARRLEITFVAQLANGQTLTSTDYGPFVVEL